MHLVRADATPAACLYIAGDYAMMARDCTGNAEQKQPLPEIVAARLHSRAAVEMLLDGEFSFAQRRTGQSYEIQLSSLPWQEGVRIDLGWAVSEAGDGPHRTDPDGHIWNVESLWSVRQG